jgi:nicotinamide phosphoribosyltransferase
MQNLKSIMTRVDSYKGSMFKQYPAGTEYVYSYVESRGGKYDRVEFLGIQRVVKELAKPITLAQIDFAEKVWKANGMPFYRENWLYILNNLGGKLPVRIRAAKEGLIIPTKNVLCTIENTDPKCAWLTTWIETVLLRSIWYPTTVGTVSWHVKQIIAEYLEKSGDIAGLPFKLHDFGARGVSSGESAEIGGSAHLTNFLGTDTIECLVDILEVYGDDINTLGYSIPASEHSTITSWGRSGEVDAYANMIKQFGKPGAIFAVVSDSYDIYKACEYWGTVLKDQVITSGATLVIRPDSGDPVEVLPKMLKILSELYGFTVNSKGYKVLNTVRIIWGDGINEMSIRSILRTVVDVCGYSADNFAFGMGGGLLQQCDRDTQEFAMKASSVGIRVEDGRGLSGIQWRDVFKDPITASNKASKKGRVTLFKNQAGEYYTGVEDWMKDELETYFEDGEVMFTQTFAQVRANTLL